MAYTGSYIPKQPYPELYLSLGHAIPNLPAVDKNFALSLYDGYTKYNGWSDKQAFWAQKMVDKGTKGIVVGMDLSSVPKDVKETIVLGVPVMQAAVKSVEVVADSSSMNAIHALFTKAGVHLKKPSIKLSTTKGKSLVLKPGKFAGTINVASSTSYPNKYYGKITAEGAYSPAFQLSQDTVADIVETLMAFAAAPDVIAAKYGKLHGKCCFCSKGLTDAKSTSVGYGPICAQHYGLPWGEVGNGYTKGAASPIYNQFKKALESGSVSLFSGPMKLHLHTAGPKEPPKAVGECYIPVLSPEAYQEMRKKVEILF